MTYLLLAQQQQPNPGDGLNAWLAWTLAGVLGTLATALGLYVKVTVNASVAREAEWAKRDSETRKDFLQALADSRRESSEDRAKFDKAIESMEAAISLRSSASTVTSRGIGSAKVLGVLDSLLAHFRAVRLDQHFDLFGAVLVRQSSSTRR